MLPPEEIESLCQGDNAAADYFQKAFAHLRSKAEDKVAARIQADTQARQNVDPDMLSPDELEALRQKDRETDELARKAFAHLRPKK